MAGGFLGDYAGMHASEMMQRGKDKVTGGEGLSAYERMGKEQQDVFAENLKQQILTQYGLIPGTREQYAYDNNQGLGEGSCVMAKSFGRAFRDAYGEGREEWAKAYRESRQSAGMTEDAPRIDEMTGAYPTGIRLMEALQDLDRKKANSTGRKPIA